MVKLFIWFNPKTGAFYKRWCNGWIHNVGDYNSYGHLLVEIYEIRDNTIKVILTSYERHKEYYNRYLKSNKR